MPLRDEYDKRIAAMQFEQHGFVRTVCLDDEDAHLNRQFRTDDGKQRTMVPRANTAGGILGLKTPGDKKYGAGVTRRQGEFLEDGSFRVEEEEENFRPDGVSGIKIEESE